MFVAYIFPCIKRFNYEWFFKKWKLFIQNRMTHSSLWLVFLKSTKIILKFVKINCQKLPKLQARKFSISDVLIWRQGCKCAMFTGNNYCRHYYTHWLHMAVDITLNRRQLLRTIQFRNKYIFHEFGMYSFTEPAYLVIHNVSLVWLLVQYCFMREMHSWKVIQCNKNISCYYKFFLYMWIEKWSTL